MPFNCWLQATTNQFSAKHFGVLVSNTQFHVRVDGKILNSMGMELELSIVLCQALE